MPYLIRVATSYNSKNKLEECIQSVCHPMEYRTVANPQVFEEYLTSLVDAANAQFKRCKALRVSKYVNSQTLRPGVDRGINTTYSFWVAEFLLIVLEPINEQLDTAMTLAERIYQITKTIQS